MGNVSIDINRENTHIFGIYNNPMNKNGGDVVDDEDELMKYIPARPQGGSPEETS